MYGTWGLTKEAAAISILLSENYRGVFVALLSVDRIMSQCVCYCENAPTLLQLFVY